MNNKGLLLEFFIKKLIYMHGILNIIWNLWLNWFWYNFSKFLIQFIVKYKEDYKVVENYL